jgi:hypothetical protein
MLVIVRLITNRTPIREVPKSELGERPHLFRRLALPDLGLAFLRRLGLSSRQ